MDTCELPHWQMAELLAANELIAEGKIPVMQSGRLAEMYPIPCFDPLEADGWVSGRYPLYREHPDYGQLLQVPGRSVYAFQPHPNTEPPPFLDGWQTKRQIAMISAHIAGAGARLELEGQTVELPVEPEANLYDLLMSLNRAIAADKLPYFITTLRRDQDTPAQPILRIANQDVMLVASSLVWSPPERALAACALVHTEAQSLKAITATLYNNARSGYLLLHTPQGRVYIDPTRRKHITVSRPLEGAIGAVTVLLHPRCGHPQESRDSNGSCFYVLAAPDEDSLRLFGERLALALPWPTLPEWSEYLLAAGREAELVTDLPRAGEDWSFAVRVDPDSLAWQEILQAGLAGGQIYL
jgi:hypothetical protein